MQKENIFIAKRDYLKNGESSLSDQYICTICSDLVLDPVQCTGACKKKYCRKCAGIWKSKNNSCPLKCSSPWKFQVTDPIKLDFVCPYNESCQIHSLDEFVNHLNICQHLPPGLMQESRYKREYKCLKGHNLQFFTGSFNSMHQRPCQKCGEKELSRSFCSICDSFFCVKCRTPRASKNTCPIGHKFELLDYKRYKNYICDICGIKSSDVEKNIYDDKVCNFGICELCISSLPDIVSTTEVKSNQLCDKFHKVSSLIKVEQSVCSNCEKMRPCFKKCDQCKTLYCVKCKPPTIDINQRCQLYHKFKQINIDQPTTCQICFKDLSESVVQDQICGLITCSACLNQTLHKQAGKLRRKVEQRCSQSHLLEQTYGNKSKIRRNCDGCGELSFLKLFCIVCPGTKGYCYKCKPISLKDGCLYSHKLLPYQTTQEEKETCMLCQQKSDNIVYCQFCQLFVCKQCETKQSEV